MLLLIVILGILSVLKNLLAAWIKPYNLCEKANQRQGKQAVELNGE